MGRACVDECIRQLVAMGSNPERIAILDNFCMGNPNDQKKLGALVETVKGMAITAEAYGAPFVSGKDSFYNDFKTSEGPVSISCILLLSGFEVLSGFVCDRRIFPRIEGRERPAYRHEIHTSR